MPLFESTLILLVASIAFLGMARRLKVPYPSILALAGCGVAALPFAPQVEIEPHLALALFIAPAVLDTALDLPPRELVRNWLPLTSLAVLLVVATASAVAYAGWLFGGLPIAAAITLGAIVAPPDAAAASAVLKQFDLPRRTMVVLQGESLLNDAVALLIFGAAVASVGAVDSGGGHVIPLLVVAVPGGALLGLILGFVYLYVARKVAGTLSYVIVQIVGTYVTWLLAERLHLSPISAVVALAMVTAHFLPSHTGPNDRINANAVWASSVFVLNVLAFLLMGLQARGIIGRLDGAELRSALVFSVEILCVVILVRIVWVMMYGVVLRRFQVQLARLAPQVFVPSYRVNALVAWCGMRGMVTLATAFALPTNFPSRDLIVLSAFTVVLGSLIVQGLTIRPLIALLKIPADRSSVAQTNGVRAAMLAAAVESLARHDSAAAISISGQYKESIDQINLLGDAEFRSENDVLRLEAIRAQRHVLHQYRNQNRLDDDSFRVVERELDWAELHASPSKDVQLLDA